VIQRLIPILILLAIQGYVFHRMWRWLQRVEYLPNRTRWIRGGLIGALLYSGITIFFMIGNRLPEEPISVVALYSLAYPFWIWVFPTTLIVFPFFFLRDLIVVFVWARSRFFHHRTTVSEAQAPVAGSPGLSRRAFLRYATAGVITAPVALTAYGTVMGTRRYDIHHQDIPFPDLPEPLNGLRILQISDVHSNMYTTLDDMQDIVTLVNSLSSDLIVLTGDYVSGTAAFIHPFCEAFQKMHRPALGVYAVLGNHDHWTNEDEITGALTDIRFRVLRNRTAVLPLENTHLNLIGIDYGGLKKGNRVRRGRTVSWPASTSSSLIVPGAIIRPSHAAYRSRSPVIPTAARSSSDCRVFRSVRLCFCTPISKDYTGMRVSRFMSIGDVARRGRLSGSIVSPKSRSSP